MGPEVNEAPNWSPSISLPGTGAVAGRFSLGKGAGTGAGQLQKKKRKKREHAEAKSGYFVLAHPAVVRPSRKFPPGCSATLILIVIPQQTLIRGALICPTCEGSH